MSQSVTPGFRIRVTSYEEAVGYAYVLIGDAVQTMTDARGMASIPARRLTPGDILSARFVGMESVPLVWDGSTPEGEIIELKLIPNRIDEVVVTARSRDKSQRLFRRYVEKIPTHGWYVGFRGNYDVRFHGDKSWIAQGKYKRDHIPGDDIGWLNTNIFAMYPAPGSDSTLMWQIQRYILTVKGIAERAVQFDGQESNRGMIFKYRGRHNGQNLFWIVKPYFDRFSDKDNSFQTLIRVGEASGIIHSSETISQTKYGIWTVSATYAIYSRTGRASDRFIYPVKLKAKFEERSILTDLDEKAVTVDVAIDSIAAYHFTPRYDMPGEAKY